MKFANGSNIPAGTVATVLGDNGSGQAVMQATTALTASKLTKAGDTATGPINVISASNTTPTQVNAQWTTGSNHQTTGAAYNEKKSYYQVYGGLEYHAGSLGLQLIGLGYNTQAVNGTVYPIMAFGLRQTNPAANDMGDAVLALRQTTAAAAPVEVLEFSPTGSIRCVLGGAVPVTDPQHFATKAYVDAGVATAVKLTGAQTVAGVKTFSSNPVITTAAVGTNTTGAASTAFVLANAGKNKAAIAALTPASTAAEIVAALQA